ncbi:MAG: hypothetical protein ACXADX_04330 [Candidatus Hodarchaeales archaeon]
MTRTKMIAALIFFLSLGMIFSSPSSGKVYYKAAEGDVVDVTYQRYEADGTEKDGGNLVVYLGEGPVPVDVLDHHPDATSVVRGFWRIIAGGSTAAKDYGEAMKEGDKKEFEFVPAEDGYTTPNHELYEESLYFDVELNAIFFDADVEPFGTEESDDPWGLDDLLAIDFVMPILAIIGLCVLTFTGYKIHGPTRRFFRSRVHCSCGAVATMECARCFAKSCRDCFLKHSGCQKCGSNKMIPVR